ncbi:hypothetical protein Droror1_Dr00012812 [Drosera rotundifolia]
MKKISSCQEDLGEKTEDKIVTEPKTKNTQRRRFPTPNPPTIHQSTTTNHLLDNLDQTEKPAGKSLARKISSIQNQSINHHLETPPHHLHTQNHHITPPLHHPEAAPPPPIVPQRSVAVPSRPRRRVVAPSPVDSLRPHWKERKERRKGEGKAAWWKKNRSEIGAAWGEDDGGWGFGRLWWRSSEQIGAEEFEEEMRSSVKVQRREEFGFCGKSRHFKGSLV